MKYKNVKNCPQLVYVFLSHKCIVLFLCFVSFLGMMCDKIGKRDDKY